MTFTNFARHINAITEPAAGLDALLPLLARFTFGALLTMYFWASALTKLGDGFLGFLFPGAGAYVQIFPKAMENVGYDPSALGLWHWAVVTAGIWAEFILPLTILSGLFTRLSALGMIGFIIIQSVTDLYGHGLLGDTKFIGGWFDRIPDAMLMDQRLLWIFPLLVLVIKGAGALSVDRAVMR
jgi:putative oxidoreductase